MKNAANDIVDRIISQAELCPEQTFALVGYSQGAGIVHKAAEYLPANLQYKVKSISTFGDPNQGENLGGIWPGDWPYGLQGKVRSVCAIGDPVSLAPFLKQRRCKLTQSPEDLRCECHVLLQSPHLHSAIVH